MKETKHTPGMDKIKTHISSNAELPKDVVLGVPILTITGQQDLVIENHRGIIEYTNVLIRIKTKNRQIKITGNSLKIIYYTNDELKITGYINTVEYLK